MLAAGFCKVKVENVVEFQSWSDRESGKMYYFNAQAELQCHTTEHKTEADSKFGGANCNKLFGMVCTNLTKLETNC